MEGTAIHRRLTWQLGEVVEARAETARARSLTLAVPEWPGHRPGQHVDVRLTAEDGYQAERSYSIASPPEAVEKVTITVERLDDGEVSPYLVDEVQAGDHLELRGPIGGYFVWEAPMGGPLLLVGGGSGIVPLMAMIRHRRAAPSTVPIRLLYSSRTQGEVIYRDELDDLTRRVGGIEIIYTLTRTQPLVGQGTIAGSMKTCCGTWRGLPCPGPSPGLHLRPHAVCRDGCNGPCGTGVRSDPRQDRTLRSNRRRIMESRLDGNVAGGILGEIFPFEMTSVLATCAGCGATDPIGAFTAYVHGMGTVVRCPSCDTALMRLTHVKGRYWVDLRGARVLQISEAR